MNSCAMPEATQSTHSPQNRRSLTVMLALVAGAAMVAFMPCPQARPTSRSKDCSTTWFWLPSRR